MATTAGRALGKCRILMSAAKVPAASKTKSHSVVTTSSTKPAKGLMKPMPVSPILKDFLGGIPEVSRPEAMKKIWDYIKLHNLQNPSDKRQIICDKKLKTLFSDKETVGMLEVAGLLSPHFVKTG